MLFSFLILIGCKPVPVDEDMEVEPENRVVVDSSPEMTEPKINYTKGDPKSAKYQETDWLELIPEAELNILLNPPDYIMEIADGTIEDQISDTMQNTPQTAKGINGSYEQALISTNVIEEMDGKNIRIPGFVVPVEFNDEQMITGFFLVPYFGACLHMPPPPPNQVIYVEAPLGFFLESIYQPVLISGILSAELFEDQLATSAYLMEMAHFQIYDE